MARRGSKTTPVARSYRSGRPAGLAVAGALLVAACSGSGDGPESPVAVDDDRQTIMSGDSGTTGTESTAGDGHGVARHYEPGIDELAFAADAWPTTVPATDATTVAPATATTTGGGGAPVTTTGGGGGGDVSIYQGVLGTLGPDEVVAPAVAPAPTVGPGILPLTGLPGAVPARPAAVVKIDNGGPARPQTGLNAADIVVEEEVEGGITRLAAVFHSTATVVGPIRSARTTDIGIVGGLGSPLLLYSGANQVTDDLIRAQAAVQNRSAASSSGYWRSKYRKAPSNLYSDTAPHWASASGGPPPPQFAYRADGAPVLGSDVSSFKVSYKASKASWAWDGSAWLRSQGGSAHETASGGQVSAANVVVIEAQQVATGMVDSSGAKVPEFVFVGSGPATVFTSGKRIDGIWTRPTLRSVATLTTTDGSVIELTPGRTWIELIGAGSGILG